MPRKAFGWLCAMVSGFGSTACMESTGPSGVVVEVHDGNGQTGLAGWSLEQHVSAVVRDGGGTPLDGVWVEFTATAGGGAPARNLEQTDGEGVARTRWFLGPEGAQRLTANLPGSYRVPVSAEFHADLLPPDEADLVVVHGALGPMRGAMLSSDHGSFRDPVAGIEIDTLMPVPPRSAPGTVLAVFGHDNRPVLVEPAWTSGHDVVHVTVEPPVPVDLWLDVQDGDFDEVVQRLGPALDTVELIWRASAMGITVGSVTYSDRTERQPVWLEVPCSLPASESVVAPHGHIQVSLVAAMGYDGVVQGYACDDDLVYVTGTGLADPGARLLAHELGHTFSLLHASRGVMGTGPAISDRFHDGEVFRAHFSGGSALNVLYSAQPADRWRPCQYEAAGCPPPLLELRPGVE